MQASDLQVLDRSHQILKWMLPPVPVVLQHRCLTLPHNTYFHGAVAKCFCNSNQPKKVARWHTSQHCFEHRITETQNCRIGRGLKRPLEIIKSNPPTEAGSIRAGCTGTHPGGFKISAEKQNPQHLWVVCSSAPSPSKQRTSPSCSDVTSCASVCAHCPLSFRWVSLKRVWPHPLDTHP